MGALDALLDPQFRRDVVRGALDAVNRGAVAGTIGGPVDLLTMALRPLGYTEEKPVMGSEWIGDKLQRLGLVTERRNPVAEALASVAIPGALSRAAPAVFAAEQRAVQNLMQPSPMNAATRGQAGAVYGGKYAPTLDAKYGDKVDAYLSDSDGVTTLSKIVVPEAQRGQGVGTAFMQDLIGMADADGVTLALSPSKDFGGNLKRLNDFYREQGFLPNKGKNKDFTISESMLRPPRLTSPKNDSAHP